MHFQLIYDTVEGILRGIRSPVPNWLRWRQIHPPTHLFYFTRPSLSAMCRKLGFDVVSFATVTVNLRLRSALLNLHRIRPQTLAGRLAQRACRALPRFLLEACFPFNLGDTVLLVARRRG